MDFHTEASKQKIAELVREFQGGGPQAESAFTRLVGELTPQFIRMTSRELYSGKGKAAEMDIKAAVEDAWGDFWMKLEISRNQKVVPAFSPDNFQQDFLRAVHRHMGVVEQYRPQVSSLETAFNLEDQDPLGYFDLKTPWTSTIEEERLVTKPELKTGLPMETWRQWKPHLEDLPYQLRRLFLLKEFGNLSKSEMATVAAELGYSSAKSIIEALKYTRNKLKTRGMPVKGNASGLTVSIEEILERYCQVPSPYPLNIEHSLFEKSVFNRVKKETLNWNAKPEISKEIYQNLQPVLDNAEFQQNQARQLYLLYMLTPHSTVEDCGKKVGYTEDGNPRKAFASFFQFVVNGLKARGITLSNIQTKEAIPETETVKIQNILDRYFYNFNQPLTTETEFLPLLHTIESKIKKPIDKQIFLLSLLTDLTYPEIATILRLEPDKAYYIQKRTFDLFNHVKYSLKDPLLFDRLRDSAKKTLLPPKQIDGLLALLPEEDRDSLYHVILRNVNWRSALKNSEGITIDANKWHIMKIILEEVPYNQRRAILLKQFGNLTSQQIAMETGHELSSVDSFYRVIRKRINKQLLSQQILPSLDGTIKVHDILERYCQVPSPYPLNIEKVIFNKSLHHVRYLSRLNWNAKPEIFQETYEKLQHVLDGVKLYNIVPRKLYVLCVFKYSANLRDTNNVFVLKKLGPLLGYTNLPNSSRAFSTIFHYVSTALQKESNNIVPEEVISTISTKKISEILDRYVYSFDRPFEETQFLDILQRIKANIRSEKDKHIFLVRLLTNLKTDELVDILTKNGEKVSSGYIIDHFSFLSRRLKQRLPDPILFDRLLDLAQGNRLPSEDATQLLNLLPEDDAIRQVIINARQQMPVRVAVIDQLKAAGITP